MEIFFFHLMPWPHIPEDLKSPYLSINKMTNRSAGLSGNKRIVLGVTS
jgi:hypothetical protein